MPSTYPSREAFESDFPNVKGTGLGPDWGGGRPTLIVLVTRKYDESVLDSDDIVLETVEIDGTTYRTDVEPVGIPHALALSSQDVADHRARHRPIPGGISIGNEAVGAGTMGSPLLEHEGDPVTLTNAHVAGGAREQYQPSQLDGGAAESPIGTLREASPLDPSETQTTDSALIDVDPDLIDDTILGIGPLAGIDRDGAEFGRTYLKSGRTTGVTQGELRGRDVQVNVAYGADTIRFTGCDLFSAMSAAGDSGSLIGYLNDEGGFWAPDVLFAGSDQVTIGIPLTAVEAYHGQLKIPDSTDDTEDETGNKDGSDDSGGGSDDGSDDDRDHEHQPERTFEDYVEGVLVEEYGEANVERQYYFSESGRYADLIVDDPHHERREAWELENDSGSVVNGSGQSRYYATALHDEDPSSGAVIPVLGVPEGHIDEPERRIIEQSGVTVREISVPYSVSLEGV